MEEFNPYTAPKANSFWSNPEVARIREAYLPTESHIKAVGVLFMLGSAIVGGARWMMAMAIAKEFGLDGPKLSWSMALLLVPFIAGVGLCRLDRWAGSLALVLVVIGCIAGVLGLPGSLVGLVVQALLLRFLLNSKTRRVFARDYAGIIRSTPSMLSPVAFWVRPVVVIAGLLILLLVVTR